MKYHTLKTLSGLSIVVAGEPWYFGTSICYFPVENVLVVGSDFTSSFHYDEDLPDFVEYTAYLLGHPSENFTALNALYKDGEQQGRRIAQRDIRTALGIVVENSFLKTGE